MIDLILTNCGSSFIKAPVLETGISGYHNMIFCIFKHSFIKRLTKNICYRDFKNFDQKAFYLESKM